MKAKKIILALGSNTRQEANMRRAVAALRAEFPGIVFSDALWTEPVGVASDRFLNMMAQATTLLSAEELKIRLRQMEAEAGDPAGSHRKGIVNLDIDLLQYHTQRLRPADWEREYIQTLLRGLEVCQRKSQTERNNDHNGKNERQ